MAIEKIDAPKAEWTPATLIQLGVAGILFIVACVLGWLSFSNWQFKRNAEAGFRAYDSGQAKAAQQALESAISWNPKHTAARQLLAKIYCDDGILDKAAREYQTLRSQQFAEPQLHVGLGVIALKKALKHSAPKDVEAAVKDAQGAFRSAGDVPEAQIGLGHCELVLAQKLNDPRRLAAARGIFDKLRASMDGNRDFRARVTRDGLVDYYSGLGKSLASAEPVDYAAAAAAFRACSQYVPTWLRPMSNVLLLEAKRLAAFKGTLEELRAMQTQINALRNQASGLWRAQRAVYKDLRDPWYFYSLAAAEAAGKVGSLDDHQTIIRDLTTPANGFDARLEAYLLDASLRTRLAMRDELPGNQQDTQVGGALTSYTTLLAKLTEEGHKDLKARTLNGAAWMESWRGGWQNNATFNQRALDKVIEAQKLFPDDYLYNRNALVLLRRLKKPPTSYQPYLDKAKTAAGTEWAEDFDKVQKYLDSK